MTDAANVRAWSEHDLEPVPACPICEATNATTVYTDLTDRIAEESGARWRMVRCRRCSTARLDPRPNLAAIGTAYQGRYFTHTPPVPAFAPPEGVIARFRRALLHGYLSRRFGYDVRPRLTLLSRLLAVLPGARGQAGLVVRDLPAPGPHDRLLDVGCGNGEFLLRMTELGWTDAHGIEPDPDARAFARGAGLNVIDGPLDSETFADDSFTALTMSHVIEHLHDPCAVLRECRRVLRPGGLVWIETPNLSAATHRSLGSLWRQLDPPRHLCLFTRASLRRALEDAGFIYYYEPPPVPLARNWVYRRSLWGDVADSGDQARELSAAKKLSALRCDALGVLSRYRAENITMVARVPS